MSGATHDAVEAELAALRRRIIQLERAAGVVPPLRCARSVPAIVVAAAELSGIPAERIVGRGREADVYEVRAAAAWVARRALAKSSIQIGRMLGNRDHSSILWAVKRAEKMRAENLSYRAFTDALVAAVAPPLTRGPTE